MIDFVDYTALITQKSINKEKKMGKNLKRMQGKEN